MALPGSYLLCPLLTSVWRSESIAQPSVDRGYRLKFVFTVGRLVSRRCHSISVIPFHLNTLQTSQGKTCDLPCVNAGFIKYTITSVDGGLRCHVPTRPRCTTPHIRFLYIVPHFRIGLPLHPASRRRTWPSPYLRLHE